MSSAAGAQPAATRPCGAEAVLFADTTIDARDTTSRSFLRPLKKDAPRYPDALKRPGVQGDVWASFIVDSLGHVVPGSAKVSEESHPAFGQAVCTFLTGLKLVPIRLNGHAARVLFMNVRFRFTIG
jgi:outer membrane biosynthesis protein TonB